ncbi:Clp protease family protein (plasmid) [Rhizobium sp. NXC24]|nr:Clp protease family protein [Rhizobium sp. NXC24]
MTIVLAASAPVGAATAAVSYRHLSTTNGTTILLVEGSFETGDDPQRVALELTASPAKYIAFNSAGGDRSIAMAFGKAIRKTGLPTLQTKGSPCLNTCLLAFMGGASRYAEDESVSISVETFATSAESGGRVDPSVSAAIKDYLSTMGVSASLLDAALSMQLGQSKELNLVDMAGYQLVTAQPSGSGTWTDIVQGAQPTDQAGAVEVFNEFQRVWSGSSSEAAAFLRNVYADRLQYYGKDLSREDVLKEKSAFVDRWPTRIYAARPGSVHALCADRCSVFGIVDWYAFSATRKKGASGAVNFALTWDPVARKIIGETGKVIETDKAVAIPDRIIRRWILDATACSTANAVDAEVCKSRSILETDLNNSGWCNRQGLGWRQCGGP